MCIVHCIESGSATRDADEANAIWTNNILNAIGDDFEGLLIRFRVTEGHQLLGFIFVRYDHINQTEHV